MAGSSPVGNGRSEIKKGARYADLREMRMRLVSRRSGIFQLAIVMAADGGLVPRLTAESSRDDVIRVSDGACHGQA